MSNQSESSKAVSSLYTEVEDRFGVLPNFFRLAPDAPEVTENLWGFAKFGYLDNPLPSLFKERLFVYLSQFCEVRYCISRHVGFLVGLGRPSGDRNCSPETVEQIVRLIRRPFPKGESLEPHIEFCMTCEAPLPEMPEAESFSEEAIFSCAAHLFLQTPEANRCLEVLRRALGGVTLQQLLVFITFVRTAHFWTKVHPELQEENDIAELLNVHEALAECVLHDPTENDSETTQVLLNELVELRKEREQAELLRVTLASIGDAVIATDSLGQITTLNTVAEELTGWTSQTASGKPLDVVFQIVDEETRLAAENPAKKALREGIIVGLANHTVLIAKDGTERFIDDSAAPIRDASGNVIGSVLVFRDISKRRQAERELEDARNYAEAIVDTVREPMIVLDADLRIQSANRSFYQAFQVTPQETERCRLYDLGNGQWNIPRLRSLVEEILLKNSVVEDFEVEHDFPDLGLRTMLLNASKLSPAGNHSELVLLAIEDITERKRGEEGLRRLASVVESSNDAIITKSLDGIIQNWNTAAERTFGYSAEEAVGCHISLLIPDERIDEEDRIIAELRAGKRVEHFDTVRRRKDGESVHVSLTISPVKDATGRVIGASKIARDITERKKVESAELHFKVLFEEAPGMLLVLDREYNIITASNAYLKATMTDRKEIVGRNIFEVFPDAPDDPEADGVGNLRASLDRVRQTKRTDVMSVQRYPIQKPVEEGGGFEERFWSPINSPVLEPQGKLISIIHRVEDVTEYVRKTQQAGESELPEMATRTQLMEAEILQRGHELREANQHLREHEQRFRTLVEQVEDYAIFMTDPRGRATSWNEGVLRVLGFTEAEFIGVDIVPSIFRPEDVEKGVAQAELDEAAATGSSSNDRWMMRKDGRHFWAAGVTTGLHDEKGRLLGFMKVMRDQTQWKKMEDELRQLAADLSDANRRKTEFLATLGHELRNPLAPIRTGLEAMKMMGDDPDALAEIHNTMERQVQQMVRLIDDLLDISRITQDKMELRTCRVALNEVVQSAVEATKPFIDEAGHELTVTVPPQAIYLDGDPNRLAQVFSNLLNNSAKYTPEGGQIWLTVAQRGSDVVVTVKDDGLGIPADKLDNIFEMFTQIDRPLEKGYSGLGIGLTLVKRLVNMHNGSIEVRSEGQDQGSEFNVRLPILVESVAEESASIEQETEAASLRILVVDDNKAAATMLKMVVKMLGNEVRTAHDGQQAVEVAAEFLPNVVLMDLGMPKMDGYEAARHIREQPWGQDMLLVALTGWGQEEDRERTDEAGFDHHLVKPAEPVALQQLLANHQSKTI